jgi:Na+/H+ antiporter NhaD/arsenite permease-like protein
MVSVSSSFATPIGSPTHMLVYGPGGYRFSDFMRIGLLMNLIIQAANIFIEESQGQALLYRERVDGCLSHMKAK